MLYFITWNKNKFSEVKAILLDVEQLEINLPEIQEIDPYKIIQAKLIEARKHHDGEFIVEDTSLYMDCLNGIPWPLIKWFLEKIGNEWLFQIAEKFHNYKVVAKTLIWYSNQNWEINFFEWAINWKMTKPQAETNFGRDPIFIPDWYDCSFAEITKEEKNKISHRRLALDKLKEFLDKNN